MRQACNCANPKRNKPSYFAAGRFVVCGVGMKFGKLLLRNFNRALGRGFGSATLQAIRCIAVDYSGVGGFVGCPSKSIQFEGHNFRVASLHGCSDNLAGVLDAGFD